MKCELHSFIVSDGSFGRAVTRCVTHGWDWSVGPSLTATTICPLGRIEQATDEAITKIQGAARGWQEEQQTG